MNNGLTIKDIAKHAGVGTSTVSRVLNNHKYVSDEKRQKVLQAIQDLDYRPNANARWLRGSETGLVGFITDEVATTPYAVDIIRGAQDEALKRDHVLMVVNAPQGTQATAEVVEFLLERQVVGIIYAAMFHREVQVPDNIYQIRAALANCYVEDRSLPAVVPDEVEGGYLATRQLLKAGHRRIAFLNVTPPAIDAAEGRLAGYRRALAEYNVPYDEALVGRMYDESKGNYEATKAMLAITDPPTGFFVGNDRSTIGCYEAIKEAGLRIPQDIGIVGFDNQRDIASHLLPALTTLQLPHYEMGAWAFRQLFTDDDVTPQVRLSCPLIVRSSV